MTALCSPLKSQTTINTIKTINYYKLKQCTYCRQNTKQSSLLLASELASLLVSCSCVFCSTNCRLLSRPFKVSSLFFFALLTVFLAPYVSVFDVIIGVLIAGVVLAQKVRYFHEVYVHDIDSRHIFEVSKHDVVTTFS